MDILGVTGNVLFTAVATSIKDAVVEAVSKSADLFGANLSGADLRDANLSSADLFGVYLHGADLRGANLFGANLYGSNLHGATLRGANLFGANLSFVNLYGADLYGADLRKANLCGANLSGANLDGLTLAQLQFIPEEGSFVGWKKCRDGVLVKLLITADAKRSHGTDRKCRASKVEVLEVIGAEVGVSNYDSGTEYRRGSVVESDTFSEDRWNVCAHGIHFFITRAEAENHSF